MADTQTQAAAAQPQATEGAPTPPTSTTANGAPQPVAGPITIDAFLDGLDAPSVVEAKPTSEAVNPTHESEDGSRKSEVGSEAQAEATTLIDDTPATDPDEEEEATALAQAKDEKVPKWVPDRLAKNAEQKRELKEKLTAAEQRAQAAEDALAQAAASVQAPMPASPLAYLDTPEKLDTESKKAVDFLDWAETPEAVNAYQDDEKSTAEQKLAHYKANARYVLKHQGEHAKILQSRTEITAAVRKAAPALFDGKSEDAKERARLYVTDPRTLPEYDQLIADALRGRRERMEETTGKARFQRIDLAAAKANGAAGAKAAAAKVNGKTPPIYTPPASASRAPVRSADAPDPRASVWDQSQKRPVSIDEMETAGAFA